MPAQYVIHAVGPVWHGGERGEPELLASCYRRSIEIAAMHSLASIAFPCISTGVYGYPLEPATEVAIRAVRDAVSGTGVREVVFCCFSDTALAVHAGRLDPMRARDGTPREPE